MPATRERNIPDTMFIRRLTDLGLLMGPSRRHTLLPLLVLVLAAEGWLVAGSIWQRSSSAQSPEVNAAVAQAREESDSPIVRFMTAPETESDRQQVRAIMQVYLERFRKDYLEEERGRDEASPYLQQVGPASPKQEIQALSRFLEERGFKMLEDLRRREPSTENSSGNRNTTLPRLRGGLM